MSLVLAMLFCVAAAQAAVSASLTTAADLDGDHRPDFATAGASRRDGAGYVLDVTFRLSSVDAGVITVRTKGIAGHIFARDLDGDADGDLVLESFDREPLAVLLNDGGGHFHQANLDDFRARLRKPDSRSFEELAHESDSTVTGESPANPAVWPEPSGSQPDLATSARALFLDECVVVLRHSNWSTRGPPASV
jgi:hypothetical protein